LTDLLTEKRVAAEPTGWSNTYRLRCLQCGAEWVPELRKDGRLPTGYWRCPIGCNAPPAAAQLNAPATERAPVLDLATLPALLTAEEVGAALRLHPNTVKGLFRAAELPARKIGGQWRMLRDELIAYLSGDPVTGQSPQGNI
jgi:hypothetical protein